MTKIIKKEDIYKNLFYKIFYIKNEIEIMFSSKQKKELEKIKTQYNFNIIESDYLMNYDTNRTKKYIKFLELQLAILNSIILSYGNFSDRNIVGSFGNFKHEYKKMSKYKELKNKNLLDIGVKYYSSLIGRNKNSFHKGSKIFINDLKAVLDDISKPIKKKKR